MVLAAAKILAVVVVLAVVVSVMVWLIMPGPTPWYLKVPKNTHDLPSKSAREST